MVKSNCFLRLISKGLAMMLIFLCGCELFESETTEIEPKVRGCRQIGSFNYNPLAEEDDGSCMAMQGCLGYASGLTNSGTLGTTLGNAYYDQKMNQEVAIQRQFFNNIPANVYILYENSAENRNAYATQDGKILFGYHMFYTIVNTHGELPVAGVLAHEWGHRTQYTYNWRYQRNAQQELEADAFSGFYMALAKQYAWSQINSYYVNVYESGDYNFNSPVFHGTKEQRLAAALLGVQTALQVMYSGTPLSYQQLHEIFLNQIINQIGGRTSAASMKTISYPVGMTREYIQSLFPRDQ